MSDAQERRDWTLPPELAERHDLNRDDESERELLILAEHPELERAIEEGLDEIVIDGQETSPTMHVAIHQIVANQLWDGDPPETWETARRLTALGYDRHEVLHMLGSVVTEQVWAMLHGKQTFDRGEFARALAGLPASWERERAAMAAIRRRPARAKPVRRRGRPKAKRKRR